MKGYITYPFDDRGVQQVDVISATDKSVRFRDGFGYVTSIWNLEEDRFHTEKDEALKAAERLRATRIRKATDEISRLRALAPVSIYLSAEA